MKYVSFVIPLLILLLLLVAMRKKIKTFDCFAKGAKNGLMLIFELFPFFAAILIMTKLFEACGLFGALIDLCAPFFNFIGIDKELIRLMLLKPFSGSGSLAILDQTIKQNGADSYVSRCAAVIFSSSETVFFIAATYYAKCKTKKCASGIVIALFSTFASAIVTCLLCQFI